MRDSLTSKYEVKGFTKYSLQRGAASHHGQTSDSEISVLTGIWKRRGLQTAEGPQRGPGSTPLKVEAPWSCMVFTNLLPKPCPRKHSNTGIPSTDRKLWCLRVAFHQRFHCDWTDLWHILDVFGVVSVQIIQTGLVLLSRCFHFLLTFPQFLLQLPQLKNKSVS